MFFPRLAGTRRPDSRHGLPVKLFAVLLFTLQLLVCDRVAFAQNEPPEQDEEVVRVRTDLVVVPVYVTDARGRRVGGLTREDFQVLDNGRPVEVGYFAAGAERVALLFLLDASGSTRDVVTQQRETALALFSRFGQRSRVAVMQFRERPELTAPFTRDLRAAREAFRVAALPDRRTAIFDAAREAVRAFAREGVQTAERRIVVLLSDGLDTASTTAPDAVLAEARAAGVSFYVIHVPLYEPRDGRLAARRPAKGFRELAEKTGGQFFVVGDARTALDPRAEFDLTGIFRAIAEDLQSQYVLGYQAGEAGAGPGLHRIEVKLSSPRDRRLRVRQLRDSYESRGGEK
ncbi:MAG TPA: VWA domain-containing protein [Pyrinomonadaceae bacterium]|nr:VWA domain-containing protein [Pyrinomonadaceae bacterium]